MVLGLQFPPNGPATGSRFSVFAICFGDCPAMKSRKTRPTTMASAGSISLASQSRTSRNSQGDRDAQVENRQEAAVENRRGCDSERVRAHPEERQFPAKPDRRVDPDSAVEIRGGALDDDSHCMQSNRTNETRK